MSDDRPQEGRRVRVYSVPAEDVMELFRVRAAKWPDSVRLLVADNLPAGARVVRVRQEWSTDVFDLLVEHESFGPVPPSDHPPAAEPLRWEWARVENVATEDGCRRLALLNRLERENADLRAVFSDLREDSPAIKAAYEQGRADALRPLREAGEKVRQALARLARECRIRNEEYQYRTPAEVITEAERLAAEGGG